MCTKYLGFVPGFWLEMEFNRQRLVISSYLHNGTSVKTPKPHGLGEHKKCGRGAHLEKGMGSQCRLHTLPSAPTSIWLLEVSS